MHVKKKYYSNLLYKSGIASIDQAILSALNFFIAIVLIKFGTKLDYGYYSIAFSITLFIISVQNAVVTTPLAVLLAGKINGQRDDYSGSLCYGQFILILPAAAFAFLIIVFLKLIGLDSAKTAVAAAVCFASIGILARQFMRSYFFAYENSLEVLKLDTYYVVTVLIFILFAYLLLTISVVIIYIIIGICGLIVFIESFRKRNWQFNKESIKESYKENWKFGKWSLFGVCVTHIQNYSYIYFIGLLISSEAVADVSAARLMLMPLIFFEAGWIKIVVPHGSKLREEGKLINFYKEQIFFGLLYATGVAFYVIILLFFQDILLKYILPETYKDSFNYILLWGFLFSIGFIGLNANTGLQVIKRFDAIAKLNFVSMILTVGCSYFFIQSKGISGGLIALIIGRTSLSIALWCFFSDAIIKKSKN